MKNIISKKGLLPLTIMCVCMVVINLSAGAAKDGIEQGPDVINGSNVINGDTGEGDSGKRGRHSEDSGKDEGNTNGVQGFPNNDQNSSGKKSEETEFETSEMDNENEDVNEDVKDEVSPKVEEKKVRNLGPPRTGKYIYCHKLGKIYVMSEAERKWQSEQMEKDLKKVLACLKKKLSKKNLRKVAKWIKSVLIYEPGTVVHVKMGQYTV